MTMQKGATVVWGDMHQHYDIGRKVWYNCDCVLLPETSPPSDRKESSPSTTDTPFKPVDVGIMFGDNFLDVGQKLGVALNIHMERVEAHVDFVKAALHHIKELLIHVQPPSSSRMHVCPRGLTYREEQWLIERYQWEAEMAVPPEQPPTPKGAGGSPGSLDQGRKSTR